MRKAVRFKKLLFSIKQVFINNKGDGIKKRRVILKEIVFLFFTDYSLFEIYFVLELYRLDNHKAPFIGKRRLFNHLDKKEKEIAFNYGLPFNSYDSVIKDKFYSLSTLHANDIATISTIALLYEATFFFEGGKSVTFDKTIDTLPFPIIIKSTNKEYNEGFNLIEFQGGVYYINGKPINREHLEERFKVGTWVVQPLVKSHKQIQLLNSSALNTTRIMTMLDGSEVKYLGGYQAIAVGSASTDSWGNGAIYVGIDSENNQLKGDGFFHYTQFGVERVREHPDNGIGLDSFEIPFLKEAVELCCKAHRFFPYTVLIGWDVAITDSGPFILEGNERPGITAFQLINGGLKQLMNNKE